MVKHLPNFLHYTAWLVSPGTEGLDLLGVKEPEDEILHQPRPQTVTTTPTTPATLRKRTGANIKPCHFPACQVLLSEIGVRSSREETHGLKVAFEVLVTKTIVALATWEAEA